jgi:hypothetical protein
MNSVIRPRPRRCRTVLATGFMGGAFERFP